MMRMAPRYAKLRGINYAEALQKGLIKEGPKPTAEEIKAIEAALIEPKAKVYGLRYPERDSKTPADYMRISYKEEDEAFFAEQQRKTLTEKEQKKLPREVLAEGWEEDMSIYLHKRKP